MAAIIEINLVLDDEQNADIRQMLQNRCHTFSVSYCMKMVIKVNQIHSVSYVLFSIVLLRFYIKYNKSYRSWQLLKMVIFYDLVTFLFLHCDVLTLWRHKCIWRLLMSHLLSDPSLEIQVLS